MASLVNEDAGSESEYSDEGSDDGGGGGGMDMLAGMACESEEEEEQNHVEEDEEAATMTDEEMNNTDLGSMINEFEELDFKMFNSIRDAGGGHAYAHIARAGERSIAKMGVSKLKARKIWKTAVSRAKEREAELKADAPEDN